ncbi:hypothetical protein JCM3765_004959 [Sporobolomyces pararoseus]
MSDKRRFSFKTLGHKKKDSTGLEQGVGDLNLQGEDEAEPVTPRRRWSFGRSRDRPVTPGAPSTAHQQHLVRPDPHSRLPHHSAADVLLERLILCEPNTKFSARLNKVAEKEGYQHIGWETTTWETEGLENGKTFEELFVQAITRNDAQVKSGKVKGWRPVNYFPQVEKVLVLESDVGESVLSNILNPLVDIFNLFIHPDYKHRLQCVIRSQQDEKSSRLDHAIYLTEIIPPLGKDYELQLPLVVIEEKAPGIVREQDWNQTNADNWIGKLIPQLFLYAQRSGCSRFFLTNYSETIGVRINLLDLESAVHDLELHGKRACHKHVKIQVCSATHEFSKDSSDKLPCDYGFRMGIASEVFLALIDLGVADYDLIDTSLKGKTQPTVKEEIANYLKKPLPRPRRDSESPSAGRERLPYSAPPPSP